MLLKKTLKRKKKKTFSLPNHRSWITCLFGSEMHFFDLFFFSYSFVSSSSLLTISIIENILPFNLSGKTKGSFSGSPSSSPNLISGWNVEEEEKGKIGMFQIKEEDQNLSITACNLLENNQVDNLQTKLIHYHYFPLYLSFWFSIPVKCRNFF